MKIYYWSPFISEIATVSSVIRSAESITKYTQNKKIEVCIIDAIGEWKKYERKINPTVKIINLQKKNIFLRLPKHGFIKSRLSYIIIFFLSFFKLLNLIKKEKPDFIITHLLTSLPIFLTLFTKNNTKIILRISGLPKLNIFRSFFWKLFAKNIDKITCPTQSTLEFIKEKRIFNKNKICLLRDPIINLNHFAKKKREDISDFYVKKENLIVAIGRLTKQKNFVLLLRAFKEIATKYPNYQLFLLGEGEEKEFLKKELKNHKIESRVSFLGQQQNVYKFLLNADCFILTSLWEDPGFVLAEAALSNIPIISSNCPNGPTEILANGLNGFLFKNNSLKDLLNQFDHFKNSNKDELYKKKLLAKKEIRKFTLFSHYTSLKKIINFNVKN